MNDERLLHRSSFIVHHSLQLGCIASSRAAGLALFRLVGRWLSRAARVMWSVVAIGRRRAASSPATPLSEEAEEQHGDQYQASQLYEAEEKAERAEEVAARTGARAKVAPLTGARAKAAPLTGARAKVALSQLARVGVGSRR